MVLLRPDRRTVLHGFLKTILHDTVKDAVSEMGGATRAASANCVIDAMAVVLSAVHEALSVFAEDWNAGQPDPLIALPPELLSNVFRRLDFSGRLSVSHVCASWRRAALADRFLWAEYAFSDPADDTDGEYDSDEYPPDNWDCGAKGHILSVMLQRSSPLPFRLSTDYVPDTIADIIIAHLDRMEALRLGPFQTWHIEDTLLTLDIPKLKSFEYRRRRPRGAPPLSLSPGWADRFASCLEHLYIHCEWVWPADRAFSSLKTFTGDLPEIPGDNWRLADVFPCITELRLRWSPPQTIIDRLEPLPHSLTSLRLGPELGDSLDYSRMLGSCGASGLRVLEMYGHTSSSSDEAVRLFLRTFGGKWKLKSLGRAVTLSSVDADEPHNYKIDKIHYQFLHIPGGFSSLERVCELQLSLSDLLGLWGMLSPGTALPSLCTVIVHAYSLHRLCELENGSHIDAPALHTVVVGASQRNITPRLSIITAAIVRAFRAPTLADIELRTTEAIDRNDIAALADLTRRVTVRDHSLNTVGCWTFIYATSAT